MRVFLPILGEDTRNIALLSPICVSTFPTKFHKDGEGPLLMFHAAQPDFLAVSVNGNQSMIVSQYNEKELIDQY